MTKCKQVLKFSISQTEAAEGPNIGRTLLPYEGLGGGFEWKQSRLQLKILLF